MGHSFQSWAGALSSPISRGCHERKNFYASANTPPLPPSTNSAQNKVKGTGHNDHHIRAFGHTSHRMEAVRYRRIGH